MLIDILTIFPKMFEPVLGESIIKRALQKGLVKIKVHDLRDYSADSHRKVDDLAYGSGGMVFTCQPLFDAIEKILNRKKDQGQKNKLELVVLMSPQGQKLTQSLARQLMRVDRLVVIAPRYEGIDQRVIDNAVDMEISIGDYVVSGGELPAMVLVDSIVRLIPGVVSDRGSVENESFEKGVLDCPHYTRPQEFRGLTVPQVLLSGDSKKIKLWRNQQAITATKSKRPDLIAK